MISDPSHLEFEKVVPHTDRNDKRYQKSPSAEHPFDLSFNDSFNDDVLGDERKRDIQPTLSVGDKDSIIDSDLSLDNQLMNFKEQKKAEDQEAEDERKRPPEVTDQRKFIIKTVKQKVRHHESLNFD
jgi:hypothetical protein